MTSQLEHKGCYIKILQIQSLSKTISFAKNVRFMKFGFILNTFG